METPSREKVLFQRAARSSPTVSYSCAPSAAHAPTGPSSTHRVPRYATIASPLGRMAKDGSAISQSQRESSLLLASAVQRIWPSISRPSA
jgi:hypothetical protein